MNTQYDYIIIGGGPCGMTLAWLFGKVGKRICLLEKESVLGGCHRVNREDGFFVEHGPRIYSSSFLTFRALLESQNLNFFDMFTPYTFQLLNIKFKFTIKDYLAFGVAYMKSVFDQSYGKDITVQDFMISNGLSAASLNIADHICRMSDGAGADRFTLFQFLAAINQQAFYKIYQPKIANDKGLIQSWTYLLKSSSLVDIFLNVDIKSFTYDRSKISSIEFISNGVSKNLKANEFILTLPAKSLLNDFSQILPNAYPISDSWVNFNSYNNYITVDYHWLSKIDIPNNRGFNENDPWATVFIVVSNYFDMSTEPSKTIITASIGNLDGIVNGKTANQYSQNDLLQQIFVQIQLVLGPLPQPDKMILNPNVSLTTVGYQTSDSGYIRTIQNSFIEPQSPTYTNLSWVGPHNGNSKYYFTSIESAVANSIAFANTRIDTGLRISHPIQLSDVIIISLFFIVCVVLFIFSKWIQKRYSKR